MLSLAYYIRLAMTYLVSIRKYKLLYLDQLTVSNFSDDASSFHVLLVFIFEASKVIVALTASCRAFLIIIWLT